MSLTLRYLYTKALAIDSDAQIIEENVDSLPIEWICVSHIQFGHCAGFLYFVTDEAELPSSSPDTNNVFACVIPRTLSQKCSGIPRIVVSEKCNLNLLFKYLINEADRYRNWHKTISELLTKNPSYQSLVDATAKLVPRPMYIADASWRMISRVDFEMNEMSATWHYQILHNGLYPYHIVDALNRTGDYHRISNLSCASLVDSQVYTMRILAKPIRHNSRLVGYFFIIDTWGDLGFCEVEIAQEFGTMIAPLLAMRDVESGSLSGFQDNFIFHILDGVLDKKHEISQQLHSETKWTVDSNFRLVTTQFTPSEYDNHLLHMRTLGMLMGNYDSHAYSFKNTAVAIFHDADKNRADFMHHLEKCAVELKRTLVVSSRFRDFSQLKAYYDQNMRVTQQVASNNEESPKVILCDREFRHLLANCCEDILPNCYEAEVLYTYDIEHKTNLCETLFTYLICERNAVITANTLYLHRNTLRNRLSKIANIIDICLDEPEERLRLAISLNTLLHNAKQ